MSRSRRRPNLLAHTTAYIALALLMTAGLTGGFTPGGPPAPPREERYIEFRPATPEESLRHQLEQAYEMDQIKTGQR